MPKTLNILLPVLNEQDRLESGVRTLAAFVIKHNIPCMLTIVDNGSSDATQEIALSLTRDSAFLKKPASASPCTAIAGFGLESRIAAPRCVDRRPSLISLRGLQSHDSNSKILESRNENPQTSKNLRIFEEKQAMQELSSRADEALFLSSRASVASVAIHSLESIFEKVDSRGFTQTAKNPSKSQAEANEDSRGFDSASAEFVDCHANASAFARNDSKKVDSGENATNVSKSQAEGFCDDFLKKLRFGGFQGAGAGIYLGDNEQARAVESTKSAQKPTPTSPKIQYLRLNQKGVGLALQAGIDHNASLPRPCEFIGYMDIDLSTDLTHLLEVYAKLCQGHPIVVGSRLLQGSQVVGRKLLRELTSKTLNTIIKAALHTSFSDAMCGFKFYRADIAALLRQQCSDDPSWFYCAQMLIQAQALGIEIEEIPVRWEDDALGSKVQVAKLARIYLKEIYRLRHLRRAILAHKS
ncbi:glycosyltransferase [Helicobacter canis]|uniref:Putative glycosyltransferase n=1 Tax=Helicobacter canis TaxID=29419 RepID=A0A377J4U1_9HELI|nr:glycosyltransferase [Helicobacter canis]STO97502.1 putative glycosyltransferase [Helicobacter canis]